MKTDDLADDFHSKMVETYVISRLVDLLQDSDWGAYESSVETVTALVKFGTLLYHLVLCED